MIEFLSLSATRATLKEKSDGKLLAGNRVNVREITRCFPQLPLCAHLAAGNV